MNDTLFKTIIMKTKLYFSITSFCLALALNLSAQVALSGYVNTRLDEAIENVTIKLYNGASELVGETTTNNEGFYNFNNLAQGNYSVAVEKEGSFLNGTTTFDLVLIRAHIIGLMEIDNPFTLLASDVNNSGTITTLDMVQLRQLILGLVGDFQGEDISNWIFARSTIEFTDPSNPFTGGITNNEFSINLQEEEQNFDFIGIKRGDVNNSAIPH